MKYSIITINYNNSEGLERTIQSVVNQTYQDFEYIIIDGGSTDGSVEVIKKYADRIDFWVSESDKGIYNAMNKGILQAHGEYLNFMNSGDSFYDSLVLEKVMQYKGDILFGNVLRKDINQIIYPNSTISLYSYLRPEFNHQATFFNSSLFDKLRYDENLKIVADWKLIIESILKYNTNIVLMNILVAIYDNAGISSNVEKVRQERINVLYDLFPSFVASDYEKLMAVSPNILNLVLKLSEGYRINKVLEYVLRLFVKFYHIYKK